MMDKWLEETNAYLAGTQPSIADLSACCELEMLKMINFEWDQYTHVTAWMVRMFQLKEVKDAHNGFYKVLKKLNPDARL